MGSQTKKLKIGISVGDPHGIGMETIIKTFIDNRMMEFCTPIIFGSNKLASEYRKALNVIEFNLDVITFN